MKFIIFLAAALSLHAQLLLSPFDAMALNYGEGAEVKQKNIMLSKAKASEVSRLSQVKLDTNIYKIYSATKGDELLGYGVLVMQKVRSKDAAVLSLISPEGELKGIEIIAFNEPPEYIPSKNWTELFKGLRLSEQLVLGKDIPTISGSTLSARSATKAARVALAIYEIELKQQP
ncbi:MAG: FMN-binding protein [Campylobacterales bacterium]|nr:FMN-binding protein [Campylobacterales bacterium]